MTTAASAGAAEDPRRGEPRPGETQGGGRLRESFRQHVRDAILAAARELAIERGWDTIPMAEVASRAGVSRPTLYKQFGSKSGLAEAFISAEVGRFLVPAVQALNDPDADIETRLTNSVTAVLLEGERNEVLRAALARQATGESELLRLLTVQAGPIQVAVWFAFGEATTSAYPNVPVSEVQLVVDAVARYTISALLLPGAAPKDMARTIVAMGAAHLGRLERQALRDKA